MAKLPSIVSLKREDYKDAPDWFERLLNPLNLFLRTVYEALNGNLTFGDNISGAVRDFRFTGGASATDNTLEFTHGLKRQPQGMLVMKITEIADNYTPITDNITVSWRLGVGTIIIDSIVGLTNGTQYDIRFLII